ncbi:TPA: hypothetical protein N0F65_007030 [Lagenidium giganteum]|uniref:thioredoxin-dependent peroxiredoxin n=1 Tax=Lagenidium giganteum TaxID=4803 RepID=A0AAV2YY63_9STRA|nr:TPA: hypothetical protein N0F65_007030 [Lagenidium giganteum]
MVVTAGKPAELDIELVLQDGRKVNVQELWKEHGVVFFMFPKADTPGCTIQACGFNDAIHDIEARGFRVYGLSADTPEELQAWKTKKTFQYEFLADPKHELIREFGSSLDDGTRVQRSHVIVLPGGVVGEIRHEISPQESYESALEFIKKHGTTA